MASFVLSCLFPPDTVYPTNMAVTLLTFRNSLHSWRFGVDTNGHGTVEKELK